MVDGIVKRGLIVDKRCYLKVIEALGRNHQPSWKYSNLRAFIFDCPLSSLLSLVASLTQGMTLIGLIFFFANGDSSLALRFCHFEMFLFHDQPSDGAVSNL